VAYRAAKNPQQSGASLKTQFDSAIATVTEALDSGKAAEKIEEWVSATQQ
jgi:anthranilate phosphoribosyltransferase